MTSPLDALFAEFEAQIQKRIPDTEVLTAMRFSFYMGVCSTNKAMEEIHFSEASIDAKVKSGQSMLDDSKTKMIQYSGELDDILAAAQQESS